MGILSINSSALPPAAFQAAVQPRTVDPRAVENYFSQLETNDLNDFEQNWRDLASCRSFGSREWTFVLYDVAKYLPKHRQATEGRIRKLREFIHDNFGIWENGAKPHIRNADAKGISLCIWAMAILNEPASEEFMNKWTSRALAVSKIANDQDHCLRLWSLAVLDALNPQLDYSGRFKTLRGKLTHIDFERQRNAKQIYDADLYFTRQSDIENPYRLEENSPIEGRLGGVFRQANFKIFKPEECVIPGLDKAIDFIVGKKRLIMPTEVDGHFHFWGTEENQQVATELEYDSATLFRSVLMTRLAPTLRIVRFDHNFSSRLLRIKSDLQRQACSNIFNGIQRQLPGCYAIQISKPMFKPLAQSKGGFLTPQQA